MAYIGEPQKEVWVEPLELPEPLQEPVPVPTLEPELPEIPVPQFPEEITQ